MLNIDNIKKNKFNKVWFFRFKKFDDKSYLITNDVGSYQFLSNENFWKFISWEINSWDVFQELLRKNFIKNENYNTSLSQAYAKKNSFLAAWPTLHIIVTTLRCNHKCQYCHAAAAPMNAKNMDMKEDTARKIVDTIFYTSSENLTIEFQWWESLVNWEIVKYITEYAEEKAFYLKKIINFSLVSNLTLMTDEILDYIIKHKIHVCTSLDWDEETHNYNRVYKNWNSYKEVVKWMNKINNAYKNNWMKAKAWALLTVTKKSLWKHKEIIDTYIDLGIDWIFLRPLNPYWFAAADIKNLSYTNDEFIDFYKKSMEYILKLSCDWKILREELSCIYLSKILKDTDPNFLDERSPCWACIWQVAYNYDGKIYSCDEWRMLARMWDNNFMMTEVQDTWEETYKSMMESETTKIMVQASTLDWLPWYNDSVYKPYIWVCPINSYKINWSLFPNYSIDNKKILDYYILDYLFQKIQNYENKKIFDKWLWIDYNDSIKA